MIFTTLVPPFCFIVLIAARMRLAAVTACAFAALGSADLLKAEAARVTPAAGIEAPEATTPVVNCVFLGDSLVEAGCDVPVFVAAWSKRAGPIMPLKLALDASTPEEHGAIFKLTLDLPVKLKYLIYGFVDDQLTPAGADVGAQKPANTLLTLTGRTTRMANRYGPRAPQRWWQAGLTAHRTPLLTLRSSLWNEVDVLLWSVSETTLADEIAAFDRRCESVVSAKPGFSPAVGEIIQLAQAQGASVILVEMPVPTRHRQILRDSKAWKKMHDYVQSLAWQGGAVLLNASDWVADDRDFADAAHLNEDGAKRFSARLAETISRLGAADPLDVVSR